jgi:hypothetical protein
MTRFYVSLWHGEGGSIATVIDRQDDACLGYYSTIRDGARFRELADIQATALNRAGDCGTLAPRVWSS